MLCAAGAMGIQNVSLFRADGTGVHTTHVTGPLTELVREVVRMTRRGEGEAVRRPGAMATLGVRWGAFSGGALTGALAYALAGLGMPLLPAAVVFVVAVSEARAGGRRRVAA